MTRRARLSTPPVTTCDNCGLSYYQTSAAHVCAEWTKGAKTMTTEPAKKLSTRCEYNQHGQCAYAGECECDCHRTSTTEHHNTHAALVEQRDRATQRIRELTEQLHALKTARREEQRLHKEITWAAQAMVDAVLKGNPGREMIVKMAEDLSKRLNDYYRAKDEANVVERGDV